MPDLKLLLLLALLSVLLSAVEPDILFTFDRDIRADRGGMGNQILEVAGQHEATGVEGILGKKADDRTPDSMLMPGLSGKALRLGHSSDAKGIQTIHYYPIPALNSREGTISFWVNPIDWDGSDRDFKHFFGAENQEDRLIIYKYHHSSELFFLYGRLGKDGFQTTARTDIRKWEKGEWHHVCASWNESILELHIDGRQAAIEEVQKPLENDFKKFILGEYWQGDPGNSAIDELRIFEKKLSSGEIEAEYTRLASEVRNPSVPFAFASGKRTPDIDGIIHDAEFAFGASGMHSIASNLYSPNQSQCFFSWDNDNLYLGMRTPATDLVCNVRERDGALWEDDSIELWLYGMNAIPEFFQFIFNSQGVFYDSHRGNKNWDASGVKTAHTIQKENWTFEAAIPWSNFDLIPVAGTRFRINLCRSLIGAADWTSFSPGKYGSAAYYAEITLTPDAPAVEISQFGSLYDGKLDCTVKFFSPSTDTVTLDMTAVAPLFPFAFRKEINLPASQPVQETIQGKLPLNRILETKLDSETWGLLFRSSIEYKEISPVKMGYIYTDIPEQKLFLVMRNTRMGAGANQLSITLTDQNGQNVLSARQSISDAALTIPCAFSISTLPCGQYTLSYEVVSPAGMPLLNGSEYYGKYPDKPAWADPTFGDQDSIPAPWTAITADDTTFSCWGRTFRLGGKGLAESFVSQAQELLSAPVILKWNQQPVAFQASLYDRKISHVEYQLLPLDKSLPMKVSIRAEFDGVLWFTVDLLPAAGQMLENLELEIPLKRKSFTYFDDCSSIRYKKDFTATLQEQFSVNPVSNPFFWCGGDDVGLMGGSQSRRGWYLRDKKNGLKVDVRQKEVVLTLTFIDTALPLNQNRKLEFYLQPTPVKPKNVKAGLVRPGVNATTWTGYVTKFFEHKRPGWFMEEKISEFRDKQEKNGELVFYYNGTKGVSPLTAEWNYYGKIWHNPEPKMGNYMLDTVIQNKTERNRSTWTYGCLNSKSFFDYKLDSIARFIENPDFKVMNLYFDLTWPRPCANESHGCLWRDEFGDLHSDNDLKPLRECLLRIYRVLQEKNPDAFFIGHLIASRTPSDVFFDLLLVGESYDRDIVKEGNYYGVFNPEMMRIAYSSRSNETTLYMLPQFYRALQLFAPSKIKDFNPDAPETDRAIRHYLGYLLLHNLSSTPPWKRMADVYEAQDRLGWNNKMLFYPYWHHEQCPLQFLLPKPHLLASAYANEGKALLCLLNDSDELEKATLKVDTAKLGLPGDRTGIELFSRETVFMHGGDLSLELKPRAALLISFD
ncbi:MAG: glycoside hydrolase domain-containing protein [Lentisphaeria bacterium]